MKKKRIADDLTNVVSLRLSDELMKDLKIVAHENGLPVSLTIRMILKKYFAKK